jgi:hypothetical protein
LLDGETDEHSSGKIHAVSWFLPKIEITESKDFFGYRFKSELSLYQPDYIASSVCSSDIENHDEDSVIMFFESLFSPSLSSILTMGASVFISLLQIN